MPVDYAQFLKKPVHNGTFLKTATKLAVKFPYEYYGTSGDDKTPPYMQLVDVDFEFAKQQDYKDYDVELHVTQKKGLFGLLKDITAMRLMPNGDILLKTSADSDSDKPVVIANDNPNKSEKLYKLFSEAGLDPCRIATIMNYMADNTKSFGADVYNTLEDKLFDFAKPNQ